MTPPKAARERLKEKVEAEEGLRAAARKAGVSASMLLRYMRGDTVPTMESARKLETAFGIPIAAWAPKESPRRPKAA